MSCQKCVLPVDCKTDLFVVCEGKCYGTFHATCVGLSETSVCCLQKNIIWLCNDCLADFHRHQRNQQTEPAQQDTVLRSIAEGLNAITTKATELMQLIPAHESTESPLQHTSEPQPRHSTPIRCSQLQMGTKIDESLCTTQTSRTHLSRDNSVNLSQGMFSLFLTNIDVHVTEEELSNMVSKSLGVNKINEINVRKLVPKWKTEIRDYVSFKVTLHDKYKYKALQANAWPTGIMYRQFFEEPRNTWKPA